MAVATACFGAAAVAAAMPATAFAGPQNASAQNTAQTQKIDGKSAKQQVLHEDMLHQVVVNGFISSLQNAIAIQKNANSIVEAVSSQQIGQLPGTSIADALGRLPGLAVQTVNGRPQELTIHGMSSDFISTQVDGTIQPSTANNRDVQLDQYPPSWFTAVIVHFSPSADMIDPGIAGTVDMKTMRPLSQSKPVATINANYQWITPNQVMPGPGVSDSGHDINGVFADQFLHHTLGVTFGVDLEANPSHILHQAPWGYATTQPNNALIIGGSKNYNISDMLVRNGFLGGVEWHPWSGFTSTLDLTYENTNETQQAKGAEFPRLWQPRDHRPRHAGQRLLQDRNIPERLSGHPQRLQSLPGACLQRHLAQPPAPGRQLGGQPQRQLQPCRARRHVPRILLRIRLQRSRE